MVLDKLFKKQNKEVNPLCYTCQSFIDKKPYRRIFLIRKDSKANFLPQYDKSIYVNDPNNIDCFILATHYFEPCFDEKYISSKFPEYTIAFVSEVHKTKDVLNNKDSYKDFVKTGKF